MGARDGATQGVAQHMIYDEPTQLRILHNSSTDHKLILGTHNTFLHLRSLDRRSRDALNRKNVEAAAAAAAPSSSFHHMQSNSDSHGQHQICLEERLKKEKKYRETERVRESERKLVGFLLELNFRMVKSKSKKRGIWKKMWLYSI